MTVAGTATDPSGVATVTVNGNAVAPGANGAFSATALLQTGPNAITVVATDGAGNTTTRTINVIRTVPKAATRILRFTATARGPPDRGAAEPDEPGAGAVHGAAARRPARSPAGRWSWCASGSRW